MKIKILNIIAVMCILDFIFVMLVGGGINVGTVLPMFLGIGILFYTKFKDKINAYFSKNKLRILIKNIVKYSFYIWLVSFISIESLLMFSSNKEVPQKVDYVIILGAGLNGEELSLTLYERMKLGLEYINKNKDVKVIVSGGKSFDEKISEAEAMERFLVKNNIQQDRIIKEDKSTSTMENFKFSKQILSKIDKNSHPKALIITNDFHMYRSKMLAIRNGFIPYSLPAKTPPSVVINCYIREYLALIKSWVLDK